MPEPIYVQVGDTLEVQRTKINDLVDWKADLDPATNKLVPAQVPRMFVSSPIIINQIQDHPNLDITDISNGKTNFIYLTQEGGVPTGLNINNFNNDTAPIGTQFDMMFSDPGALRIVFGVGNIYRPTSPTAFISAAAGHILTFRKTAVDYWELISNSEPTNMPLVIGGPGSLAGTPANYMDLTSGQKYYKYGTFTTLAGFYQNPHFFFQKGMTVILEIIGAGGDVITHNSFSLILPYGNDITVATGDIFEFMLVDSSNSVWQLVGSNKKFVAPLSIGAGGDNSALSVANNTEVEIPTGGGGGGSIFFQEGIVVFNSPSDNYIYVPNVKKFRAYAGVLWNIPATTNPSTWRWLHLDYYNGTPSLEKRFSVAQRSGDNDAGQQECGQHIVTPPLDGTINGGAYIKGIMKQNSGVALNSLSCFIAIEVIEI